MKPSATLETAGVSEIGRKSFSKSCTGFFFGKGVASIVFHIDGKRCSLKEALRSSVTGKATKSEYSFISHFGIWSGPDALLGLSLVSTFSTRLFVTCGMSRYSSKGRRGRGVGNRYILPMAPGKLYWWRARWQSWSFLIWQISDVWFCVVRKHFSLCLPSSREQHRKIA